MNLSIQRVSLLLVLWLMMLTLARAQEPRAVTQSGASEAGQSSEANPVALLSDEKKKEDTDGALQSAPASEPVKSPDSTTDPEITDPLIRVLVTKGVLSSDEGRAVGVAAHLPSSATGWPFCCAVKV